ncbi:MAG: hypothetical protein RBU37_22455 [Myxococcota bacterium]|jgi:hypothetical protein|nr:hypothetical protein [Myxococcota bacterium]
MTKHPLRLIRALLFSLFALSLLVALAAFPTAYLIDQGAVQAQPVRLWDQPLIDFNKWQFEEGDWDEAIVSIYGAPEGEPLRLVFVDEAKLLRPAEDPSLVLLPKAEGEHFLQAQTLFFFARYATLAAGVAALLFGGGFFVLRRRRSQ